MGVMGTGGVNNLNQTVQRSQAVQATKPPSSQEIKAQAKKQVESTNTRGPLMAGAEQVAGSNPSSYNNLNNRTSETQREAGTNILTGPMFNSNSGSKSGSEYNWSDYNNPYRGSGGKGDIDSGALPINVGRGDLPWNGPVAGPTAGGDDAGGNNPSGNNPGGNNWPGNNGGGGSGGGGGNGGGSGAAASAAAGTGASGTGYTVDQLLAQIVKAAQDYEAHQLPDLPDANPERINHVDTDPLKNMLQQIVDSQKEQGQRSIDYNVQRGTNELTRAMEDAATQYQTQRDQVSANEQQALDNQALYAEARGDRGGIGEAQYASIQNTAAQNRRAVNDAQVKLGTDTARQISDLRSQGEFEKADQLLSITQSYLSQLMNLEQWALSTNLGVDEFNSQLQQWTDEYNMNKAKYLADLDLSQAQLTGVFADGTKTRAALGELTSSLAASGNALLSSGIMPSKQQLQAMGMTDVQAKAYIKKLGL